MILTVTLVVLSAAPAGNSYGLSESDWQDAAFSSITSESVWMPVTKDMRALAPAARAAAVPVLGGLVKTWVGSDAFKKRYTEWRAQQIPAVPRPLRPVAELQAAQKKDLEKARADQVATLKAMPKETQAEMKKAFDDVYKGQLEAINNVDLQKQTEQMRFDLETQSYKEALEKYPETPTAFVKRALTRSLERTEGVDFNAKLTAEKRFASDEFESKPDEWKRCFRAGKAACEAARAFATKWLGELAK